MLYPMCTDLGPTLLTARCRTTGEPTRNEPGSSTEARTAIRLETITGCGRSSRGATRCAVNTPPAATAAKNNRLRFPIAFLETTDALNVQTASRYPPTAQS